MDPFGFKVPAKLLAELMGAGRVELFVNVMWRELDMLIHQQPAAGTASAQTLDDVFGSDLWRAEIVGTTPDERIEQALRGPEDWLETHVNEVVKQLKKDGMITADPIPGKTPARSFTIVANPVLRIAQS